MAAWRATFAAVAVPANLVPDPGHDSPFEKSVGDYSGEAEEEKPEDDP